MFEKDSLIKVFYKDFTALFYIDYLGGYEFYNLEIYKDGKCLRHSTLARDFSSSEVFDYLKNFVDKELK